MTAEAGDGANSADPSDLGDFSHLTAAGEAWAELRVPYDLLRADPRNEVAAQLADLGLGKVAERALALPLDRKGSL